MEMAYIWEYEVHEEHRAAFISNYSPSGEWARLFARAPGYLRTELKQDQTEPGRFLTLDYWESQAAFDGFKTSNLKAYDALDRACEALTTDERFIGAFESPAAGAPPGAQRQQAIVHISLVVRDYDEAIAFFTEELHFRVVEDTYQPAQDKRWVTIAPPGNSGTTLVLGRASTPEQKAAIGNQTGGRVFLFLQTDDFWRDYREMQARGITFVRDPKTESYGTVAVFEDLYGNLWDLLELT